MTPKTKPEQNQVQVSFRYETNNKKSKQPSLQPSLEQKKTTTTTKYNSRATIKPTAYTKATYKTHTHEAVPVPHYGENVFVNYV